MAKITVADVKYDLVEKMGFNHSVGMYAAVVDTSVGQMTIVKPRGGQWRFWTATDRIEPLRRAAAAGWPDK